MIRILSYLKITCIFHHVTNPSSMTFWANKITSLHEYTFRTSFISRLIQIEDSEFSKLPRRYQNQQIIWKRGNKIYAMMPRNDSEHDSDWLTWSRDWFLSNQNHSILNRFSENILFQIILWEGNLLSLKLMFHRSICFSFLIRKCSILLQSDSIETQPVIYIN